MKSIRSARWVEHASILVAQPPTFGQLVCSASTPDRSTIAEAVGEAVVGDADACATAGQPSAQITLSAPSPQMAPAAIPTLPTRFPRDSFASIDPLVADLIVCNLSIRR
eukprot:1184060-Prorocentrum_minimum.AAC.5